MKRFQLSIGLWRREEKAAIAPSEFFLCANVIGNDIGCLVIAISGGSPDVIFNHELTNWFFKFPVNAASVGAKRECDIEALALIKDVVGLEMVVDRWSEDLGAFPG